MIEIVYDQDLPSDNESSSENILDIKDATVYYKQLLSDNFMAVDELRWVETDIYVDVIMLQSDSVWRWGPGNVLDW